MRKSIRRSVAVAAASTGLLAFGATTASASELPVAPDAATVTDTVDGATDTVEGVTGGAQDKIGETPVREATDKLPATPDTGEVTGSVTGTVEGASKGLPQTGAATGPLHHLGVLKGKLNKGQLKKLQKTGKLDEARELADAGKFDEVKQLLLGKAEKTKGQVQGAGDRLKGAAEGAALPSAPAIPGLPGDVHTLPAPAQLPTDILPSDQVGTVVANAQEIGGKLPKAPAVPSTQGANGVVNGAAGKVLNSQQLTALLKDGAVQKALAKGEPVIAAVQPTADKATGSLPHAGQSLVVKVTPVAKGAVADAAMTADNATAHTAPFAEGVTLQTATLGQGVANRASGFGQGAADDVTVYGESLAAQGQPFALQLGTGVAGDVQNLGTKAAGGMQRVTVVPAQGDLTDAASIPALPAVSTLPGAGSLPVAPVV